MVPSITRKVLIDFLEQLRLRKSTKDMRQNPPEKTYKYQQAGKISKYRKKTQQNTTGHIQLRIHHANTTGSRQTHTEKHTEKF